MDARAADRPLLTEVGLEALLEAATNELRARTPSFVILIARLHRAETIRPNDHGWCELGRLVMVGRRYWWTILWHPEEGRGRLLGAHWESPHSADAFAARISQRGPS